MGSKLHKLMILADAAMGQLEIVGVLVLRVFEASKDEQEALRDI